MGSKGITNSFDKGLNTDEHIFNTKQGSYIKAKNITFTTNADNQLILQNLDGIDNKNKAGVALSLSSGYYPVAVKELSGIVYIVSTNRQMAFGINADAGFNATVSSNTFVEVDGSYESSVTVNALTGIKKVNAVQGTGSITFGGLPDVLGSPYKASSASIEIIEGAPFKGELTIDASLQLYKVHLPIDTTSKPMTIELDGEVIASVSPVHSIDTTSSILDKFVDAVNSNTLAFKGGDPINVLFKATASINGITIESNSDNGKIAMIGKGLKWAFHGDYLGLVWTDGIDLTQDRTIVFPDNGIDTVFPIVDDTIGDSITLDIAGSSFTYVVKTTDSNTIQSAAAYFSTQFADYDITVTGNGFLILRSDDTDVDTSIITLSFTLSGSSTTSRTAWVIPNANTTLDGYEAGVTSPVVDLTIDGHVIPSLQCNTDLTVELLALYFATEITKLSDFTATSVGGVVTIKSLAETRFNLVSPIISLTGASWSNTPVTVPIDGAVEGVIGGKLSIVINGEVKAVIEEDITHTTVEDFIDSIIVQNIPNITISKTSPNTAKFITTSIAGNIEIGTYPGFETDPINSASDLELYKNKEYYLKDEYIPFKNFNANASITAEDWEFTHAFNTDQLNIDVLKNIDMELQTTYDSSVNVIITDGEGDARIINSRFAPTSGGKYKLADRRQTKDNNTYSNATILSTSLIQKAIATIPKLYMGQIVDGVKRGGISNNGAMKIGGYRFFFRYSDADGNITNIIEESRNVSIFHGKTVQDAFGGKEGDSSTKNVVFYLKNLDPVYNKIKVYYSYLHGNVGATPVMFEVSNPFTISADNTCEINITGNEAVKTIDQLELNFTYSQISKIETIAQSQNRLLLGGIESNVENYDNLANEALRIGIGYDESGVDVKFPTSVESKVPGYCDPENVYNYLGYWAGETYELGVVFITDSGESPVFPIRGNDTMFGVQTYNNNGVVRFPLSVGQRPVVRNLENYPFMFNIPKTTLERRAIAMVPYVPNDLDPSIKGMFFVRKERVKDCVYQGFTCDMYSAMARRMPDTTIKNITVPFSFQLGHGNGTSHPNEDASNDGGLVWAPCPAGLCEFQNVKGVEGSSNINSFICRLKPGALNTNTKRAFYSGDLYTNPEVAQALGAGLNSYYYLGYKYKGRTDDSVNNNVKMVVENYIEKTNVSGNYHVKSTYVPDSKESYTDGDFTSFVNKNAVMRVGNTVLNRSTRDTYDNKGTHANVGNIHIEWGDREEVWVMSKYSPYIGVEAGANAPHMYWPDNNIYEDPMGSPGGFGQTYTDRSHAVATYTSHIIGLDSWYMPDLELGHACNMYKGSDGPKSTEQVTSDYANNTSGAYFAISQRMTREEAHAQPRVYGGDCYVTLTSQRIWRQAGDPKVKDPSTLKGGDPAGYNACGFLMSWLSCNNTNTGVRMQQDTGEDEVVYGTGRQAYPYKPTISVKTSSQAETSYYDQGHSKTIQGLDYFKLDNEAPTSKFIFPNRIVASSAASSTGFINGYRQFKNVNFKDYDPSLGKIVKLITFNDTVYVICDKGIGKIQVSAKTLLGTKDTIQVDTAKVLPDVLTTISKEYGAQSKESVAVSNRAVYGVDKNKNIIWQIKEGFKVLSRFNVQELLEEFKNTPGLVDQYNVKTTIDVLDNKVFFTYYNSNKTILKTLTYSEDLSRWESEVDLHPYAITSTSKNKILFDITDGYNGNIYSIIQNAPCKFRTTQYDFELEFVLNETLEAQKILDNLQILSNNILPKEVQYTYTDNDTMGDDNEYTITQKVYEREENLLYDFTVTSSTNVSQGLHTLTLNNPTSYPNSDDILQRHMSKMLYAKHGDTYVKLTSYEGGFKFLTDTYIPSGTVQLFAPPLSLINADILNDKPQIVVRRNHTTDTNRSYILNRKNRVVRDKAIKIKLIYDGFNKVYIQRIISIISI